MALGKIRHSNEETDDLIYWYVRGDTYQDIAYQLEVSPGTVYRRLKTLERHGYIKLDRKVKEPSYA